MATSKHQRTVAALRHRKRELDAEAARTAREVVRDRGHNRELVEEAIRAEARAEEATHCLALAEAPMPKALRGQGTGDRGQG